MFAILQKYDFSSKSQPRNACTFSTRSCLRYCKSTIFQANHNERCRLNYVKPVVCDTAKVRFFKQITTEEDWDKTRIRCLRYCKSTIFQANHNRTRKESPREVVVCDTAKVRFFKQITTLLQIYLLLFMLFAILQKYDFSSKSQLKFPLGRDLNVVCDTAKVRFFKQITTREYYTRWCWPLFAILQKYDFSSKSQQLTLPYPADGRCLRYCKSTIFQANHNSKFLFKNIPIVVCDTAKVRFFKQITTPQCIVSQTIVVCDTAKVRFFKQITTYSRTSSSIPRCLRYCKSTIFQANHNLVVLVHFVSYVVCDTAKVRFFKQITTSSFID